MEPWVGEALCWDAKAGMLCYPEKGLLGWMVKYREGQGCYGNHVTWEIQIHLNINYFNINFWIGKTCKIRDIFIITMQDPLTFGYLNFSVYSFIWVWCHVFKNVDFKITQIIQQKLYKYILQYTLPVIFMVLFLKVS